MKKGAIFDLDGTLIFSPNLHITAWKKLFASYGISLTEEELKEQSGYKNIIFIKKILDRRNRNDLDANALSNEKDAIVISILKTSPATVFPDAIQLLQLLKKNSVKIALATSSSKQTALILAKELLTYFDFMVFAEDVDYGKPYPEMFLKAAEGLKLNSEDCIVFEDAKSGIEAAKRGGFYCVARNNKLDQDLSGANLVIEKYNVQELINLFKK